MKILALDPGITTGFATLEWDGHDARLTSFGQIVSPDGIDRLLHSHWTWMNTHGPKCDLVAIEGPLTAFSVRTMVELHEVRGVLREWCLAHDVPYKAYHPSTVKAALTGIAGATKAQVANAVKHLFGIDRFPSDHASDAVAIGVTYLIKEKGAPLDGKQPKNAAARVSAASRPGARAGRRATGAEGAKDTHNKAKR